ncbi:MAG: 5'-3' exonuclease H3TH domain-containing protein [Nitriliruptorales bacterium]|nr:5'-3' exonuclease H3TH domain-containing protein [Nitriliruptorales bacterium]
MGSQRVENYGARDAEAVVRLHLVDGTYELFRAHFGRQPDRRSPSGRDVKATHGIMSSLLALLDDRAESVTHLAVAFDNPIESFRNDLFDGYKTSAGIDPDLLAQFDLAEEAVRTLGIVVWSMDAWEADDALATAAVRFAGEVEQVRILTPDKDLGQVVDTTRIVQVDRMRNREFDATGVQERLGVAPTSVPDHLALVGDTADGIPGLKGFGAKSTATILGRYPHLEDIPTDEDWDVEVRGAARLRETFANERDRAFLWRDLATLRLDVPLEESLADLLWQGADRRRLEALCDELGFDSIRDRPRMWRDGG